MKALGAHFNTKRRLLYGKTVRALAEFQGCSDVNTGRFERFLLGDLGRYFVKLVVSVNGCCRVRLHYFIVHVSGPLEPGGQARIQDSLTGQIFNILQKSDGDL